LRPQVDDASAEEGTNHAAQKRKQEDSSKHDDTPKKPKLSGAERRKLTKEEKKAQRGSNKGRRWAKVRDEVELCWRFAGSGKCDFGSECVLFLLPTDVALLDSSVSSCRLSHDIPAYLEAKPKDIFFPPESILSNESPFVSLPTAATGSEDSDVPSVDLPIRCPVFEATGSCRIGLKCRFLGGHARKAEDGTVLSVEDEERKKATSAANTELNFVSPATLKLLRAKKVDIYLPFVLGVFNQYRSFQHRSLMATLKSSRPWLGTWIARTMTTASLSRLRAWLL
jgi:tRNA-dihydrouridine synthase 3